MEAREAYSDIILELYKHPLNEGALEKPQLVATGGNPVCGDAIRLTVHIKGNRIKDIRFTGNGCAISQASASLITEQVKGKKIADALKIPPEQVFDNLGGIIQTRIKCALLGLHVLKEGLKHYEKEKKTVTVEGIRI